MTASPPQPANGDSGHEAQDDQVLSECLTICYDRIRKLTLGLAGRQLLGKESVEDLVQDVIVEALQHAPAFRYDGGAEFLRWIRTVTQRVIANAVARHRQDTPTLSIQSSPPGDGIVRPSWIPGAMPSPSTIAQFKEACQRLMMVFASLSETDRAVIRMVRLEQRPLSEVATTLGCSTNVVAQRLTRALRRLSSKMDVYDNGIAG